MKVPAIIAIFVGKVLNDGLTFVVTVTGYKEHHSVMFWVKSDDILDFL